eukprot:COSAG01_NODE_1594_length_9789_cov_98.477399_11_plen_79_part_00
MQLAAARGLTGSGDLEPGGAPVGTQPQPQLSKGAVPAPEHNDRDQNPGLAESYLGSAAIGSQWVQPLRHGDPIEPWVG